MSDYTYFSLIIPLYNEGPSLLNSIRTICRELNKLKKSWEIIFIEDNSSDNTRKAIKKLQPKLKKSRVIYHQNNEGRGKSVTDGINSAHGKICGYIDVDLEVSAKYIPVFIREIEKGSDLVVGKRSYEKNLASITRVLASKGYSIIVKHLLSLPIEDTETGYKFFNKSKIIEILPDVKDKRWFWDTEICARAHLKGLLISQIPVLFIRRPEKKSTVRLLPDTLEYFNRIWQFRKELSTKNNG